MFSPEVKALVDAHGWRVGLREFLKPHLEEDANCLAAWEGGSAAFQRADDLSDLDLQLIVRVGKVDSCVRRLEALLAEHLSVSLRHEIPQPAWHGMWQAFYQFSAAPPSFMLDLCIAGEGQEISLSEVERHGDPQILFDPHGLVPSTKLNWEEHHKKMRSSLESIRKRLPMFHPLVDKEIKRGRLIDGLWFYQRMILPDVLMLLRLKHCPERHDYGGRYLDRDLPKDEQEWVADIMSPGDLPELARVYQSAISRSFQLLDDLETQAWAKGC